MNNNIDSPNTDVPGTVMADPIPVEPIPVVPETVTPLSASEDAPLIVDETPLMEETKPLAVDPSDKEPVFQQKVTVAYPCTLPTEIDPDKETVALPPNLEREIRDALTRAPNMNLADNETSREWAETVQTGNTLNTYNEDFRKTIEDTDADFFQEIQHAGHKLQGQSPAFQPIENQTLKGERAVIRIMSYLGLGTLYQVPLWHTGIWITFKAPNDSELIELNRLMVSDKIEFGRRTYGLAFSNLTTYTTERLVNFALEHIYNTTLMVPENTTIDYRKIIASQDIPSLLMGLVCTMYPKGFQSRRGCVSNPESCNFVVEELLNVTKLLWVNHNGLSEWQKTHMSVRRPMSKNTASIEKYREEMLKMQRQRIVFNEGKKDEIHMTLKSHSIADYIDSGHRWISEVVDLVERTVGMEANETERNNYMTRHAQASAMRQYVHWVESVEVGSNIIEDTETIESVFNTLSSDDDIRNTFIDKVSDYIASSTIALIGIPVFDCPKCKGTQHPTVEYPHHKNIIPLDVIQLFFALLSQRLERITQR